MTSVYKLTISNLFNFLFILFAVMAPISQSYFVRMFNVTNIMFILRLILLLLATINIFVEPQKIKNWLIFALIGIAAILSTFFSNEFNLLTIIIFVMSVRSKDVPKLIKFLGIGNLIGLTIIVFCSVLGILPNYIQFQTGRIRHSLGFLLPVHLSGFYMNFGLSYVYIYKDKFTLKRLFIVVMPAFIIYLLSVGRASFYTLLLIAVITFLENHLKNRTKFILTNLTNHFAKLLYLFTFAISIIVGIFYRTSSLLIELNYMFTGRFYWFYLYWQRYSPKLFGQPLLRVSIAQNRQTGARMMILDSANLTLLLENGIIMTVIVSVLIFMLISRLKKENDLTSLIIWVALIATFPLGYTALFFWRNPLLFQFALLKENVKE